ncbi:DUF7336 domain-containing protein [Lactiplantibacillus plantarum]|uniref:DUF7336 domain-containing protein n=1 Tax=Lactiplantibacillus plantarum TaxID=1590 RepID=UPI00062D13A2|nr:hypothetical protein [Lactiplantibacillus plantarum]EKP1542708.1 hypothetical protein [Campylobacter jejuni]KLD40451.1 hypothetical protein WU67_15455 [Lactiplantibacillus plantarum]KLD61205.1 hypothetical protein WP50_04175 [Lactiplantibacillus plantarum]MCG3566964.1 hypothetical protein [Lactiplantibacillus plantarum]MCG3569975.1 hypothetical protein [Lactiplantibacillus plantarum]
MKLYVVDRDDSGFGTADYGIVGIFSTMEKANDFIKKVDNVNRRYCYDITKTELDSPGKEMLNLSVFMTE